MALAVHAFPFDHLILIHFLLNLQMHLLKSFEFFKSNKKLSYCDYRDLAQMMTYMEYEAGTYVYDIG